MGKSAIRSVLSVVLSASMLAGHGVAAHSATPTDVSGPVLDSVTRYGPATVSPSDLYTWIRVAASDPSGVANVRVVMSHEPGVSDPYCSNERPGPENDGTGTWDVPLCAPGQPGIRFVERIILDDELGNQSIITDREILDPLGYTVVNEHYDVDPPELVSAEVSPALVIPGQEVRVTLRFSDAHPTENVFYRVDSGSGPVMAGIGDEGYRDDRKYVEHADGTVSVIDTYKTSADSVYGDYLLGPVTVHDSMSNSTTLDTKAAIRIGDPAHATGPVRVDGTGVVGTPLKAVALGWDPKATLKFTWKDSWEQRVLGTGTVFTPTGDLANVWIKVWVTGTWPDGTTRTRASDIVGMHKGTLALGGVKISGTTAVGSVLTASHRLIDPAKHPNPGLAYHAYAWQRDGKDIDRAYFRTYVPTAADLGHVLTVRVSSNAPGYFGETAVSPSVKIAYGTLKAPTPVIGGAAVIGSKLTANPGAWTSGTKLAYQWLRNGKPIAKATSASYNSTTADLNQNLQVRLTGSQAGFTTVTKTSMPKRPVIGTFVSGTPRIWGTARVGVRLEAEHTVQWLPATSLKYQWLADGKAIRGGTGTSYVPVVGDVKKKISVRVTASKTGYTTAVRTSAAKTVAKGILKEGTLRYVGSKKVGTTVKVQPVGWGAGNTYSYQWKRDGNKIKGATKSAYKLQRADRGRAISVTMTVKRSGFITIIMGDGTFAPR